MTRARPYAEESIDICACGEYRKQHKRGGGQCQVCIPGDGMNGGPCHVFRVHLRAKLTYSTRDAS